MIETFSEKANDGTLETRLVETTLANDPSDIVTLDVDGNGTTDITRSSSTVYDSSGNAVITFSESYGHGVAGDAEPHGFRTLVTEVSDHRPLEQLVGRHVVLDCKAEIDDFFDMSYS